MMSRTRSKCYLINQIIIIKQPEYFPKSPDITHPPPSPIPPFKDLADSRRTSKKYGEICIITTCKEFSLTDNCKY